MVAAWPPQRVHHRSSIPTADRSWSASRRAVLCSQGRYDAAQTTGNNRKHWSAADLLSAREANSPQVRPDPAIAIAIRMPRGEQLCLWHRWHSCPRHHRRGPRLQVRDAGRRTDAGASSQNAKAKAALEAAWSRWAKRCNLAGKLQTACRSMVVDGEAFISQRLTRDNATR